MTEARLKAGIWVQAALRTAQSRGQFGAVIRRGDADSGGVLAVLRGRDGLVVLSQVRGAAGELAWMRATGPTHVSDAVADAYIARQVSRDSDLWVVEFETPDFSPPFEAVLL